MGASAGLRHRVLVTGAAGMLGSELVRRAPRGVVAVGTDLVPGPDVAASGVDLADEGALERLTREHGPFDGAIHAAAFTAVDRAEAERELADRVNREACAVLARACARAGARLVVVSTDFVFDGCSARPYREDDAPRPLSVYGATKLAGERAAAAAHPSGATVVRTQWLYGPRGQHFPRTVVRLARERGRLKVVDDQVGAPTSTLELAPALWDVLERGREPLYHAACQGACSWYAFTREILARAGLADVALEPCATSEFPRPARRPAYSVLDSARLEALRGRPLKPWREALSDYLALEPL